MSLLMDALKKAEQEKKEAAKRRELPNETGMHLENQDEEVISPETDQETEPPATPESDQSPSENRPALTDFSLEPLSSAALPEEPEGDERPEQQPEIELIEDAAPDITHTMEIPKQSDNQEAADNTGEIETPKPEMEMQSDPDQTFHGVDLEKTFNAELYEDTVQGEPFKPEEFAKSYDETLPGVPAAQLAKDIGTQDQPTPVAAQTIFTATNTIAKPTSGFRLLLISLAVLAVVSALVASYFFVTPVNRDIPSPIVARGVETIITQSAPAITPPSAIEPSPVPQETAVDITEESDLSEELGTVTEIVQDAESVVGVIVAEESNIAEQISEQSETTTESDEAPTVAQSESASPPEFLPEVIEPPTSLIKITKSSQSGERVQLIQDAFSAYQSGDFAQAQLKYTEALNQYPDSRDAMLGMAAVALQTGRQDQAMDYYLQLLRKNPLDNMARAAFLGQQGGNNSLVSISQLKTMIYDAPDQPYLFYTLGKLYAGRNNWSEAQRAFFDAYRLDTSNPDFALNLAVSLDRLGQRQAALDYYNVALGLAENNAASFQRSVVQNRINTLTRDN